MNALDKVVMFATSHVLPKWIQPKRKPIQYNWRELINDKTKVFVGVLISSDGNFSHAVTIHSGFIYDANEVVALRLCQEALDYCTSTETQQSTFIDFRRGWILQYMGERPRHIQSMVLKR